MNYCPCCSQTMLRHARQKTIYWFCPRCRQEMPNLVDILVSNRVSVPYPQLASQTVSIPKTLVQSGS